MAMTRKKIEKLIKEGRPIYFIEQMGCKIYEYKKTCTDEEIITLQVDEKKDELLIIQREKIFNYIPNIMRRISFKKLYETKEDAEFIQKFHTSKIIYFQPPTWEEFLKTGTDDFPPKYMCESLYIAENDKEIIVDDYNSELYTKHFVYNKELSNRKDKYYEAVEYMKKIFLEEGKTL